MKLGIFDRSKPNLKLAGHLVFAYFFKRFRSLNDENLGTVGQRAANALSNRPHFNSTYLVSGRFNSKIAVSK